jgi:CRISPR/Cas system CMR subunit Cmr6 (Cas7 group RAMP superfamily)
MSLQNTLEMMNNMDKTNEMMKEIIKFRQEMLEALSQTKSLTNEAWAVYVQHCDKIFPSEVWPLYEEVIQ